MTTTCGEPRTVLRGSVEYIDVTVTSNVTLDTQPVFISFEAYPYDWLAAAWQGSAGTTRTASILGSDANLPEHGAPVFVKVTHNPEVPIVRAGLLNRR